jgi:hypothetical protein
MKACQKIELGHSCAERAEDAVAEFHRQVSGQDAELVLFFCSSSYDLSALAAEMNRLFAGVRVVGCTTAGEIGPAGYRGHSLAGMSLPAEQCTAVTGCLDRLQEFEIAAGRDFAQGLVRQLEARAPAADGGNSFGLLLVDGLSRREEPVTHAIQDGLGSLRMVGGSAGDDMKFERTWVFHEGAFHTDSAVLVLVSTRLPFRIFRTQHFVADGERLVVTAADADRRVVKEINGLPAVEEYGRLVGVPTAELTPSHFAAWPVVVMIDGTDYVRSIQQANADGSLTFYCAIDEGVLLKVAHGKDLVGKLAGTLAELGEGLDGLQAVLACDCILRNLEAERSGVKEAVGDLFRRYRGVGFSTYGEQIGGVHVNQTLTGIAIGGGDGLDD